MIFQSVFYIPYAGKGAIIYYRLLSTHSWTKVTKKKMKPGYPYSLHPTMDVISLAVNNCALKRTEKHGGNA